MAKETEVPGENHPLTPSIFPTWLRAGFESGQWWVAASSQDQTLDHTAHNCPSSIRKLQHAAGIEVLSDESKWFINNFEINMTNMAVVNLKHTGTHLRSSMINLSVHCCQNNIRWWIPMIKYFPQSCNNHDVQRCTFQIVKDAQKWLNHTCKAKVLISTVALRSLS